MYDEMVGRQEMSGREGLLDCRRARLVPVTVMKSLSSFKIFVEVFSSCMSISSSMYRYSAYSDMYVIIAPEKSTVHTFAQYPSAHVTCMVFCYSSTTLD